MNGSRKIRIILVPRVIEESGTLLEQIAKALPNDDLFIKIDCSAQVHDVKATRDIELENKTIESVSGALEKANYDLQKKNTQNDEIKFRKEKLREYLKELKRSGGKVTFEAVVKGLISLIFS